MKIKFHTGGVVAVDPAKNPPAMIYMDEAYPDRQNYFSQKLKHEIRIIEFDVFKSVVNMARQHGKSTVLQMSTIKSSKDTFKMMKSMFEDRKMILP